MKQIGFFLLIIICAIGIWYFFNIQSNQSKTRPVSPLSGETKQPDNSAIPFNIEESKQPTAAEKEILEWLKADGCTVKDLDSLGYHISWTVRFHTRELPTVIAPDGYSVTVTGPDQNGNYMHVREYNYTWNPRLRIMNRKDFNSIGLTEIKRRRIDTKELR